MILYFGNLFFIDSIKGLPCSNSPKEAAWIQITLSSLEMDFSIMESEFFLPFTKRESLVFTNAKPFKITEAITAMKL